MTYAARTVWLEAAALSQDDDPQAPELHDDPRRANVADHVEDAYHRRVADLGDRPGLADGPFVQVLQLGAGQTLGRDLLDGDIPAEQFVAGVPDPAHAAFADGADQSVAVGHEVVRWTGHRGKLSATTPGRMPTGACVQSACFRRPRVF